DVGLQVAQARAPDLPWLHDPLVTLAVKLTVSALGITAVARWLFRVTGDDGEGEKLARGGFVRRFWVLVGLVVTVDIAWLFFRAGMPVFLQKGHGYGEATTSWFTTAYYISTDAGSLTAGAAALVLARRGFSVHASRVRVFAVCAGLTALSLAAAVLGRGPL